LQAPEWDRHVAIIQVTEANERAVQVRALVSALDASKAWDLRYRVREALIDFVQRECPEGLPHMRAEVECADKNLPPHPPAPPPVRAGRGGSTAITEPTHAEVQAARDSRASDVQDPGMGKGG
jgi:hypothetical protein